MIATGQHIDPGAQLFIGNFARGTKAGRRIFSVHNDEIQLQLAAQIGQGIKNSCTAGAPQQISQK